MDQQYGMAERFQETGNRKVVLERASNKLTQATIGLREHAPLAQ
jgi:hypothetical protein